MGYIFNIYPTYYSFLREGVYFCVPNIYTTKINVELISKLKELEKIYGEYPAMWTEIIPT